MSFFILGYLELELERAQIFRISFIYKAIHSYGTHKIIIMHAVDETTKLEKSGNNVAKHTKKLNIYKNKDFLF
jgi:hypothetical protein